MKYYTIIIRISQHFWYFKSCHIAIRLPSMYICVYINASGPTAIHLMPRKFYMPHTHIHTYIYLQIYMHILQTIAWLCRSQNAFNRNCAAYEWYSIEKKCLWLQKPSTVYTNEVANTLYVCVWCWVFFLFVSVLLWQKFNGKHRPNRNGSHEQQRNSTIQNTNSHTDRKRVRAEKVEREREIDATRPAPTCNTLSITTGITFISCSRLYFHP